MRLMSGVHAGRPVFGVVDGEEVFDLSGARWPNLRAALNDVGADGLVSFDWRNAPRLPIADTVLLPPIPDPDKILCVGLNYRAHAEEAGMPIPVHPSIFVRFAGSLVGHEQPVWRPRVSHQFDYEAELAVIIGRRCRHVPESDAMGVIAGYSCLAEHSVRDFQRHATQATAGKNFQNSGGFGPWLVTADEIPDPSNLPVIGRLNGEIVQDGSTADLIFSIPRLIAYVTSFTELLPGDVISTGTPSGVGFTRKPPLYLQPGDRFDVEIPGIGVLTTPVVNEPEQQELSLA